MAIRFGVIEIHHHHHHDFVRDALGYDVCRCGLERVGCEECSWFNVGSREENEEELEWHMALTRHMVGD